MVRKQTLDPNQGAMFDQGHFDPRLEIPRDPASMESAHLSPIATESHAGPAVNLIDRANELGKTMDELAQASKLGGMVMAMEAQPRAFARRYGDLERMHGTVDEKRRGHERAAKQYFARASGMYDLMNTGHSPDDAKAATREMYSNFIQKFADSKGADNRDKFRRQLARQTRVLAQSVKPEQKAS